MRPWTRIASLALCIAATALAASSAAFAQDGASLKASSLVLQESENGAILTLQGPIEVTYSGDTLGADSAVVTLGEDLTTLESAIVKIELKGGVRYSGRDGETGQAGAATYFAREHRVLLEGGARFSRGDLQVAAGTVDYLFDSRLVSFRNGGDMSKGDISASADSGEYDLNTEVGSLAGGVTVRYKLGKRLFGDEVVDEVVLKADALAISVAAGEVKTPEGPLSGRTTVEAGEFTLEADSILFQVDDTGVSRVTAEGSVDLNGPRMQYLRADRLSFSNEDRVLKADGNVEFSVMGQEGKAESIEVNFASGWSIRLVGGSVDGSVDESVLEGGASR